MVNERIMIVEDEGIVALHMENSLKKLGYVVAAIVDSGEDAIKKAEELHPDLILMDIILHGNMDGIEASREIQVRFDIPVVYVTAFGDESTLKRAKITQPSGFILKPFKERELQISIEIALHRHETETRLRKVERMLATTLRSIGDSVIATDIDGRITFMNPAAEMITGWKHDEALGKSLMEIFNIKEFNSQNLTESLKTVIKDGLIMNLISDYSILITKDGEEIPIGDSFAPIKDQLGNIPGAVIVFRDLTLRRGVDEDMQMQIIDLERKLKESEARLEEVKKELERSGNK
jgi:PAS domain S-box-containing protein